MQYGASWRKKTYNCTPNCPPMPKSTFVLKDPKSKNTAIKLLYTCSDGRLPYYTGESINPTLWPQKITKGTTAILSRITDTVNKTIERYKIIGEPLTKEALKAAIDAVLNKKTKTPASDMYGAMEDVISKMRTGEILTPKTKKKYAASSIKNFKFTVICLRRFDPRLKISTTTLSTYYRFITWCHEKDLSTNYIGTRIKNWKTLGQIVGGSDIFRHPEFKKLQEDTFDIFLDEEEVKRIIDLKLPVVRYDLVRDWFVIGCYTGLRVSDMLSLTKQNLGKDYITIANEKTDEKVVIPIHKNVKKILTKYKGFPPKITDVELNRIIKEIACKAKINDDVLYSLTKGGKRKDYYLKKWEMVSSHSMRRTAITNMRKFIPPVPDSLIKKITGIKSDKTLSRYDKITADEAARIAATHEFYK